MDLFKKYHTIPPVGFPNNWLVNLDYKEMKKLENFIRDKHFFDFSKRTRLEKLIGKTVEEFLEPVKKNKYYRIVLSMTTEELDSIQDLSHRKYEPKFFGLIGGNDVKIRLNEEDIIPHKIFEFSKMDLEEIHQEFQLAPIEPKTKVTYSCSSCGGNPHTTTIEKNPQPRPQFQNWMNYTQDTGNGHLDNAKRDYLNYSETIEVTHTCSTCKGHGSVGFTFNDFKKYVEKYNQKMSEENQKTSEINEKAKNLVEEYNQTIEPLNKKIKIWNGKCPQNAKDDKSVSDEFYLKYLWRDIVSTLYPVPEFLPMPTEKEQTDIYSNISETSFIEDMKNYPKISSVPKNEKNITVPSKSVKNMSPPNLERIYRFILLKDEIVKTIEQVTSTKDKHLLERAVGESRGIISIIMFENRPWTNKQSLGVGKIVEQIQTAFETKALAIGLNVNSIKNYKHLTSEMEKVLDKIQRNKSNG